MSIKIFISHRHADKRIADVLRKHLIFWEVPSEEIFQSSAAGFGPDITTRSLTEQLIRAVQESKVVFLIYTFEEADWSYAMWEVGLAEGDASTNVIVIQCCKADDVPKVFKGRVHVKLEKEDVRAFVKQFHTKENFFPGQPAYKPDLELEALENRADRLYEDLARVVPPGKAEERYRWDFLTLELSAEAAARLREGDDIQSVDIASESMVKKTFGEALKHFGYDKREENLSLGDLIKRWKEHQGEESDKWIEHLSVEIKRAAENRPAKADWEKMRSGFFPDWYFYPVLNYARIHPDGRMRLDVYLYRIGERQAE